MAMQVVAIDLEDWEAAVSRFVVSESTLIAIINSHLALDAPWLRCKVSALRMTPGEAKNWAVAQFSLQPADYIDRDRRFGDIARIVVEASEGYEVDWATTALH